MELLFDVKPFIILYINVRLLFYFTVANAVVFNVSFDFPIKPLCGTAIVLFIYATSCALVIEFIDSINHSLFICSSSSSSSFKLSFTFSSGISNSFPASFKLSLGISNSFFL